MRSPLPRAGMTAAVAALVVALIPAAAHAETGDAGDPLVIGYGSPNIGGSAADPLWDDVAPVPVAKRTGSPVASAEVKAVWDENYLYTLTEVTDPQLDISSGQLYNQDSVEVFVDLVDDKSAAHTTYVALQDFQFRISYDNRPSFDHGGDDRLISNTRTTDGGYVVESVFRVGDLVEGGLTSGRTLGFDVQINDGAGGNRVGQLFWHDGTGNQWQRPGLFGTIALEAKPSDIPPRVDRIELFYAITQAGRVNRAIYGNASVIDEPLEVARAVFADDSASQQTVDAARSALSDALFALERTGPYPDPKHLPDQPGMPDLFQFLDGSRVESTADWDRRREEIAGMAQYYEYGYQAGAPASLTAAHGERSGFDFGCFCFTSQPAIDIRMTNDVAGQSVSRSFTAVLQVPDASSGFSAPYPVVIGFGAVPGADQFLANGIATIAYTPTDVGNENHTGIYYDFFPYEKDIAGADTGTLMAWAWGVSRIVDAISYVDPATGERAISELDPDGIAVTGHSRYGKGTLVAGAFDDRIAVVAPNGSGTGGASSWRYQFAGKDYRVDNGGQAYPWAVDDASSINGYVETINNTFGGNAPWFADIFGEFREPDSPAPVRLPFDQHSVMALVAPRPLLVTGGFSDFGTNPESMAMSYRAAEKAYEFLDVPDRIGVAFHDGGHTHTFDDTAYLLAMMKYYLRGDTSAAVGDKLVAAKTYPFHTYDEASAPWSAPERSALTVTAPTAKPGALFDATVSFAAPTAVDDTDLTVSFDASRLRVEKVSAAAGLAVAGQSTTAGTLTIRLSAAGPVTTRDLVRVTFRATDRLGTAALDVDAAATRVAPDGYSWTSHVGGSGSATIAVAEWDAKAVYNEGDRVGYQGRQYLASWWTSNQKPGDPYGPWQEIATLDDGSAVWTASRIFDAGDVVTYDGRTWTAKWWTRNQTPGDPYGPWQPRS
ncbi:sugar-binding protein [Microbacterium ulmi]|uniref:Chitin-binding type-3 domain-containing protein n=1 Tax=Microbacterium ulmi TaxID=179095 RepID=A0A7Y2PZU3_9MICO|nr:sugar-binding protein [Microbacterium ulmi]NII71303.1 hypothetical protein [Microbacterium ulmi]NNH02607.1 hypothetical protein [Microbacterium ulmi]